MVWYKLIETTFLLYCRGLNDDGPAPYLPPHLVPDLMSWAMAVDASPRVLKTLLKAWPDKRFGLLRTSHLAFNSPTATADAIDWVRSPEMSRDRVVRNQALLVKVQLNSTRTN